MNISSIIDGALLLLSLGLGLLAIRYLIRNVTFGPRDRSVKAGAKCRAVPLMNRSETQVFEHVHGFLTRNQLPFFVSPQISYGGFLKTLDPGRWREVNFKRADLVIWDRKGKVHLVLEYDGRGHRGDSAASADRADRADAVKDVACVSAGIPIIRIQHGYDATALDLALDQVFLTAAAV